MKASKPNIKVVCGIIRKDDKFFIARRKLEKSLGGFWEFPGGKLEEGENPIAALERELLEELGMKVEAIQYFGNHEHEYDNYIIDLIAYSCVFVSANFEMTDHDEVAFIRHPDFKNYKLAPADIFIIEKLQENAKILKHKTGDR